METYHGKPGYILLVFLIASHMAHGQDEYRMVEEKSRMVVRGTSSLHDWDMKVERMEFTASFLKEEDKISHISHAMFRCDVSGLKSDHKLMDKKTRDALMADKHPGITFRYISLESIRTGVEAFGGTVEGILSIAGRQQKVFVPFQARVQPSGDITLEGTVPLKMSDYGIDPPTALMGTLKTGNEIEIDFSLVLEKGLLSSSSIENR